MAKTFSQLQARAAQLVSLEAWSESSPKPDWQTLVNDALATFSWECEHVPASITLTSVVNQQDYNLTAPPSWIKITDVVYAGTAMFATQEAALRLENPLWMNT